MKHTCAERRRSAGEVGLRIIGGGAKPNALQLSLALRSAHYYRMTNIARSAISESVKVVARRRPNVLFQ